MGTQMNLNVSKSSIGKSRRTLTACGPSPSYAWFVSRGPDYYAKVAGSLDEIAVRDRIGEPHIVKLSATVSNLPPILHDLHPTYLLVSTNGVLMTIGNGRVAA